MQLYTLDPMLDTRWDDLVASHPSASVFHRKGWLRALAMTYGYHPIVITGAPPGKPLSDGILFCEVKSWITGSRLVSLPFSDHCDPLLNDTQGALELTEWMRAECPRHSWRYIELRPLNSKIGSKCPFVASQSFWLHTLDLTPSLEQIFGRMHKSCVQRRIRRAERDLLSYETGCSESLVDDFYGLITMTRRRHQLLPQPRSWFRNLIACMNPDVEIRVVRKDALPIAAILTLRHGRTVVYKYGCSNERFHHLGAMPFLFWKLIKESKAAGAVQIDLGRTDLDNDSLIEFKNRLGAARGPLTYFRYPKESMCEKGAVASCHTATRGLFSVLPDAISSRVSQLLYRHIG